MSTIMSGITSASVSFRHSHSFLGAGHEKSERKTWAVIGLCGAMMIIEIVGGLLFGSIALIADGLHMNDWGYACFAQLLGDDIIKSVGQIKLGVNVPANVQTYRPM